MDEFGQTPKSTNCHFSKRTVKNAIIIALVVGVVLTINGFSLKEGNANSRAQVTTTTNLDQG